MAATPKLNRELIDEFLTYKENGISDKDACDMCGISESTFYGWVQDANKIVNGQLNMEDDALGPLKVELMEGMKRARAAFKAFHIQNITKAAKKSWQASAWMLERMYPKEFSHIDRQVAIMGEAGKEDGMLNEILEYLAMTNNGG